MKILIFATHPIQYQVPIYRELSKNYDLKVIYLLEQTKKGHADAGFGVEFEWDIPLTDGYQHQYLKNKAETASSSSYKGVILDGEELKDLTQMEKPDLVFINGWFPKALKQIINYCYKNNIKTICRGDSTLLMTSHPLKRIIKEIYIRSIVRKITAFLYVGEENKKYYLHYGVKENQLYPGLHCINTPFFEKKFNEIKKREWNQEHINIGFAGKFIDIKRPLLIVSAIANSKYQKQLTLQLIGDGPLKVEIENAAKKLNVNINFLGFLNQSEIVEKGYQHIDFLVLSSRSETWGLVINEVMTGGIPAIVSDTVGCNTDLIEEEKTGFVFRSGDATDLSQKIDKMVEILSSKNDMNKNVLNHIKKYSLEETIKGYKKAIEYICFK
ncbi:glycosyltransferase family 4 protein [Vicingus serpentipes]|uniref:Glycosyltransferase family 4 protein n=1 Tax=Vicingus serpentipes TaxID=1926625 RepID=A0A5C6RMY2_9FLAO|nr:glycosyltransferase family 4 protein [Vicingus serpentipes]TXB63711.1 glycosyltransferase family 4 protein [Vicingus serpentipes]